MSTNVERDPFEEEVKALKPVTKVTIDTLVTLFIILKVKVWKLAKIFLRKRDQEIENLNWPTWALEDKVDVLEQHGRHNTVPVSSIPGPPSDNRNETTDTIVINMVNNKFGIENFENDIVRSRCIGKSGDGRYRDINVKFVCHRVKTELVGAQRKLTGSGI